MNTESAELLADINEQVLYMKELGVELMDAALPESVAGPARPAAAKPMAETVEKFVPAEIPMPKRSAVRTTKAGSRVAVLPSLSDRKTPRIETAGTERQTPSVPRPEPPTESAEPNIAAEKLPETIEELRASIGDCTRCPLSKERKRIVHSTGNFNARLMFIGEAPGADEDEQGKPFVGRAGNLLTKIIEGIGLKREDVFIGNINRCRPPGNRAPVPEETAACKPFLLREIEIIRPKVIVVLGATAAHNLLEVKTPISHLRGTFRDYHGVKVMPTFHPAYLLRDPHKKREVWEDMKKVRDLLNEVK